MVRTGCVIRRSDIEKNFPYGRFFKIIRIVLERCVLAMVHQQRFKNKRQSNKALN